MSGALSAVVRAAILWSCIGVAHAATFTVDSKSVPGLNPKTPIVINSIRVSGPFEPGDADKLRKLLVHLRTTTVITPGLPLATAELSSLGGDFYEGLNVGYLFKEFDVATLVRSNDVCLSACALAFLGGTASHVPPSLVPDRSIQIGGQVGFHNFFLNTSSPSLSVAKDAAANMTRGFDLARGGSSLLVSYGAAMGLDPTFISLMLGRPSDDWDYVDIDGKFVDLTSCPIGIDRPRVSPQAIATNICNHSMGGFSIASPAQARRMMDRDVRKELLELVERNLDAVALKGPLRGQLAGVLASRDDRLIDAVYSDLRLAGVPLPELVGPTFQVGGYATGAYQMQCLVSFSLDDPDRYEVAIQGPGGMTRSLRSAPKNCRRLFLFERDDMLNPPRNQARP